jgi:hypothetical protein
MAENGLNGPLNKEIRPETNETQIVKDQKNDLLGGNRSPPVWFFNGLLQTR